MEDYDLQSILKQLARLEKRVHDLETIINGSSKRKPGRKSKLSPEQKLSIIERHEQGLSYSVLASEYNVSRSTICNICRGHDTLIIPSYHKNVEYCVKTYKEKPE